MKDDNKRDKKDVEKTTPVNEERKESKNLIDKYTKNEKKCDGIEPFLYWR